MLIDSHCHLDMFQAEERGELLARAEAAGVGEVVTIGTRLGQSRNVIKLASENDRVWCTVGIHPNNAGEEPVPEVDAIVALANHPKVIGIGESGLDYFYKRAARAQQQASFRQHIKAARATGLPLVIHARAADEDIAGILQEEWDSGGAYQLILHCFSSGRA